VSVAIDDLDLVFPEASVGAVAARRHPRHLPDIRGGLNDRAFDARIAGRNHFSGRSLRVCAERQQHQSAAERGEAFLVIHAESLAVPPRVDGHRIRKGC